jgi:hypothetical protein
MQGIALVSGFACCFEARKGALRLAKAEEFEALKDAAVNADLVDEIRERILQLQARGYGKAKIILEIWGVTKGGSPKYKAAEAEYKRLAEEGG